ncbi:MAG: hypothetical protein KatS3mg038_2444 [Candidatus Kapaibacterium sp.]|nr:MAG: hypothetical protein KatS3mg038_2444 [Candidatus Kapabacteria bacterium]
MLVLEHVEYHIAGPAVGELVDHVYLVWVAAARLRAVPAEGPQIVESIVVGGAHIGSREAAQAIAAGAVEDVRRLDLDAEETRPAEAWVVEIGFGVAAILREAGAAEDYGCYGPRAIVSWALLSTIVGAV